MDKDSSIWGDPWSDALGGLLAGEGDDMSKDLPEIQDDEEEPMPTPLNPRQTVNQSQLEETWWLLDGEDPALSDILTRAGASLDDFFRKYRLRPVKKDETEKIFLARYEFPQFGKKILHTDAIIIKGEVIGWVDLLSGFPMRNTEMMLVAGEFSSREKEMEVKEAESSDAAPVILDKFPFEGVDEDKRLLNYLYIDETGVRTMADDLQGEPPAKGLHWWTRINMKGAAKYPYPGEFLCLCNRAWPTAPWGEQGSNPYIFSGNWMDTVYYTSGKVENKTEGEYYPTYRVRWRKGSYDALASDFAEYVIGERVTILKDLPSDKNSQTWKDLDGDAWGTKWAIVPAMFYQIDPRKL